ncbi:MAG TPA: DNA polymerase I [Ktedonobacterales bacterium]|nr:DNA polymerase I [Ktedonobacterales bacterium]
MSSAAQPRRQAGSQANGGGNGNGTAPLVLIDGNALYHRSFHAFPEEIATSAGEPTNAVFGFTRMLLDVLKIVRPEYLIVTFDRPTPTFRHDAYQPYKAHRPPMPDGLRAQFPRVREIVKAFNIPIYECDGFEADDLLGTLALQAERQGLATVIATGDLDTLQLVDDLVRVTFARSPRRGDFEYFDHAAVVQRYGFEPPLIVDYKALVGDTSDNIPGVPGIGAKTATKLIQDYGTLEEILAHRDELPPRTKTTLTEHEATARQSKYLATIVRDAPVSLDLESARALRYDPNRILALFRELEFHSLVDRLPRATTAEAPSTGAETVGAAARARAASVPTPVPDIGNADGLDDAGSETPGVQLSLFADSELQALEEQGVDFAPVIVSVAPPRPQVTPTGGTSTMVIDTPDALDVLARSLEAASLFAFDLETDNTDEMRAHIVGLSFSMGPQEAYYVPVGHVPAATTVSAEGDTEGEGHAPERQVPLADVLARLRPALINPALDKVAHNAKYDMMVLARHGVWVEGLASDTMVAAYLLNPGRRSLGLKEQAFENLGVIMQPITDLIGTGRKQITMAEVPVRLAADYAGADADMTLRLMRHLEPQLRERGLESLFREVELPLIPVLARMELAGIRVDRDFLRRMGSDLDEQLKALEIAAYAAVGHEFNLNSPKQLGDILFGELKLPRGRKTKTGYSVDAATLDGLRGAHEVVDLILEYRTLAKLKSTYVDGLLELVNAEDGHVHTSFNQTIAATGRLSSSNPNLQNIPVRTEVGKRIRRAFLADEGSVLLTADYSQIELRILAHVTHEPALVAAFEHDEDVHAATAAQLFKVSLSEVTPDQRRLAKTVNFAVLYGQSAFGLANTTGMSNSEAAEFIKNYEQTFPRVREYVQSTLHMARTQGYVQTLLGRKRYFPDFASLLPNQRMEAEREAINMPIQGTNADMIKIAMANLDGRLRELKLGSQMILQVHDELVLEVPEPELDAVSEMVRDAMVGAMTLDVPVKVEMKAGHNWYEVKPLNA